MRTFSQRLLFGTAGLMVLAPAFASSSQTVLSFEPLLLQPYQTAFVLNGSCPQGQILKLTGALRGLERRRACVALGLEVRAQAQPSRNAGD